MIINLTGPVILHHPYADRNSLSVLTLDTREGATVIYDGRVYREEGTTKHGLLEFETQYESYIRTSIPLGSHGVYRCYHKTDQGDPRQTTFKTNDDMIVVETSDKSSGVRSAFAIDLKWDMDLKEEGATDLWAHILSE
jgi:hypothetical protein